MKIGMLIVLPLILFFGPIFALWGYMMDQCFYDIDCCTVCGWILFFISGIISITFGSIAGALALSILLVPIYIVQIYRLL